MRRSRWAWVFLGLAWLSGAGTEEVSAAYEPPNPAYNPGNYYNGINASSPTLRMDLHNLVSGLTGFPVHVRAYGDARYALQITDQDPNNPNNILLVYNRASVAKIWDSGATWNREHVMCQSWLGISVDNNYTGPGSDLFELRPCSPSVNSSRGNTAYGYSYSTGSPFGHVGGSGGPWYPGDADAGDIARTLFYMATRYYTGGSTANINNILLVNGTGTPLSGSCTAGDLTALLRWHYADGVDNFERRRNQCIFGAALNPLYYQGNRNPYIDHPEYVWKVFGGGNNNSQLYVNASPNADGSSSVDVSLGRIMVGGTLGTSNVTLTKAYANPTTYDIGLSGDATCLQYGAGQCIDYNAQTRALTVGLSSSTATPGLKSGTIGIKNTDLTSFGPGRGSADGDDTINVTAAVLNNRTFTATALGNLGLRHRGESVNLSTTLSAGGGTDNESTRVTVSGGTDGTLSVATNPGKVFNAGGQTDVRTVTGTLNAAGTINGAILLSTAAAASETAAGTTPQSYSVAYSVQVFSGAATWTASASGNWGDHGNWSDANGIRAAPGKFVGFDNCDTAAFDGTGAGGTISLNGISPSLKSIHFSGATVGYTIHRGDGSSAAITMKADVGPATIAADGTQSHRILAPIDCLSDLNIIQTGAASVTLGDVTTSSAATLGIEGTIAAARIDGSGATLVAGTLTADSIVQDNLAIGAGGAVVIRETVQNVHAVPEPGVLALLATGAAAAVPAAWRRRRTRAVARSVLWRLPRRFSTNG